MNCKATGNSHDTNSKRHMSMKMLKAVKNFQTATAINILYTNDIDINVRDRNGNTMLHWAAATRNMQLFQMLLEKGANKHSKNHEDHSISDIVRRPHLLIDQTGDNKEN